MKKAEKVSKHKKFKFDTRIFAVIGILIFLYIISKSNLAYLFSVLANLDYRFVILSFLITILTIVLKSVKWKLLITEAKFDYSIARSIIVWVISFAYGFITPGRAGDFIRVFYLKQDADIPKRKGFIICLLDRLVDLASLAIITLVLYSASINIPFQLIMIIILFSLVSVLLAVILDKLVKYSHERIKSLYYLSKDFVIEVFKMYSPKQVFFPFSISITSWFFSFLQSFLILLAMGKTVPFLIFSTATSTAILVSLLPISIGGLGTTEATLYFFLSSYLSMEEVIALAFVSNVVGLWIPALIGFVLNGFKKLEGEKLK
ncbi:Lysylphosphatidylglycerol synthase TM region [Candidatus Tiddalikarchaeum anstoanum]|nr:Lysylphosphatidylglycerol synthase TM region [Candidatus Tiddalikarchaeum anstoanum]